MSISFFDDLGGLFLHFGQLLLLGLHGRSSEVECNPKMSISFFDDLGGLFSHFGKLSLLRLLSQSSEVKRYPKMRISFFDDLGGLFCISVDFCHSDHSSDHQKLNVIQKPTFHFEDFFFNPCGGGGGVHHPIFLDLQLFESFPTKVAQNDPQWPILPPKWLRLA